MLFSLCLGGQIKNPDLCIEEMLHFYIKAVWKVIGCLFKALNGVKWSQTGRNVSPHYIKFRSETKAELMKHRTELMKHSQMYEEPSLHGRQPARSFGSSEASQPSSWTPTRGKKTPPCCARHGCRVHWKRFAQSCRKQPAASWKLGLVGCGGFAVNWRQEFCSK